mmetsp:Transcript_81410/g.128173  ORF Transcript_81410/g.128173 Transcript_81410/m.128173 type:complete len:131 (+) Transcript_81410:702-1094(+)
MRPPYTHSIDGVSHLALDPPATCLPHAPSRIWWHMFHGIDAEYGQLAPANRELRLVLKEEDHGCACSIVHYFVSLAARRLNRALRAFYENERGGNGDDLRCEDDSFACPARAGHVSRACRHRTRAVLLLR